MTFPDKYLQKIVFKVGFQEVNESELLPLQPLFKAVFNLNVDANTLRAIPFSPLKFGDSEKVEQWELNSDSITITIDGDIFKSFEETVVPLASRMQKLLESAWIKVNRLYLNEIYIIPDFNSGNNVEMLEKEKILFSEKLLDKREGNVFLSNDTTTMYRFTESTPDKMNYNIIWGTIVKDDTQEPPQPSRYVLDVSVIDREPFNFNTEMIEKTRTIGKKLDSLVKTFLVKSSSEEISGNISDR